MELLIEHLGHGLMLSLLLSLPCVLMAAGIGLIVGILQAVTQVQEQTIAAAPKILGVFGVILLGGGLMMSMLSDYVRESAHIAFNEVPQDGLFVLPPQRNLTPGQARARRFFDIQSTEGPKSDRFRKMTAGWEFPDAKAGEGAARIKTVKPDTRREHTLGPAERMTLNSRKNP